MSGGVLVIDGESGAENVMAPCLFCRVPFMFNPVTVPSIRANPETMEPGPDYHKQAVCFACFVRTNKIRAERGLPPWTTGPRAYTLATGPEVQTHEG